VNVTPLSDSAGGVRMRRSAAPPARHSRVTGVDDSQHPQLAAHAQCVCLAAGIRRLENLEETVAFFKRR